MTNGKAITCEQLLAWARDKYEYEAEELRSGYKAVELMHSPALTITLVDEGALQPCVDVRNAIGSAFYGQYSDTDCFYDALRIAYLYSTAEVT